MQWRIFGYLLALLFFGFMICLVACDDDDPSTNSGQAADDDTADDDDTSDDDAGDDDTTDDDVIDDDTIDDDTIDDDTIDDDTGDDDTGDDDTEPSYLLVMGDDAEGKTSFLQTDKGWEKQVIPPPVTYGMLHYFGPTFFVDGQKGYAVWNAWGDLFSYGYDLLMYDPATGWDYDVDHLQAGTDRELNAIFAPTLERLWVVTTWFVYFSADCDLWKYIGNIPLPQLPLLNYPRFEAIYFPDEVSGLVSGWQDSNGFQYRYANKGWQNIGMPAGYENGAFTQYALVDSRNGWAIWEGYSGGRKLMEVNDGDWSEIAAPTGCDGNTPTQVFGRDDYAVTVDRSGPDNRFWEYRDGEWTCRDVGGSLYDYRVLHASVWRNGRVFLAVQTEFAPYYTPLIFEVTVDDLLPVAVPEELTTIEGLHALGSQAPKHSGLIAY